MMEKEYDLTVTYPGGLDRDKDRRITKQVKRNRAGSGCTLIPPYLRDLGFIFKKKGAAYAAAKRVRNLRIKGIKASVSEYTEYIGKGLAKYA